MVAKLYEGDKAYLLQHKDRRVIFVIPYQKNFHLVGTTDIAFEGDPKDAECTISEIEYLCEVVSNYFHHPLRLSQVLHTWSGVRPLVNLKSSRLSAMSREYVLDLEADKHDEAPLLNVFGGKLTTYRALSEEAVSLLKPHFPKMGTPWTHLETLPGGDVPQNQVKPYEEHIVSAYPFLPAALVERYVLAYGTRTLTHLLKGVESLEDLGECLGHGLYERELHYLMEEEWVTTIEDVLWRRTKLGMIFSNEAKEKLQEKMTHYQPRPHRLAG